MAVLEAQVRPTTVRKALAHHSVERFEIVLLDCSPPVRRDRLCGPRLQPDLATPQMDSWAAYLRGQADALELPVIGTNELTAEAVADLVVASIERLRAPK